MVYDEDFTRFTNLEVTGKMKLKKLAVDGIDEITAPTAAGDSYSKAQVKSLVDAVNGILALLGAETT